MSCQAEFVEALLYSLRFDVVVSSLRVFYVVKRNKMYRGVFCVTKVLDTIFKAE